MRVMGKDYPMGTFDAPQTKPREDHPRDLPNEDECSYEHCGNVAQYENYEGNFYCHDCVWSDYQEHLRDVEPSERPEFEDYLDEENLIEL